MNDDLPLTSADAAAHLGVSITSVKRWADVGLLACVKTAGKHRRFDRTTLDAFRARLDTAAAIEVSARAREDVWTHLLGDGSEIGLHGWLLGMRDRLGAWWRVAESLGPVIEDLGVRWARGGITVFEEHIASERLARALARISAGLAPAATAPRALLATVEQDEHTLGLSLVEVVLAEQGFRTVWLGRRTPVQELIAAIDRQRATMVCVSASAASRNESALKLTARRLASACRARGTTLLLGGNGSWPEVVPSASVVRDLSRLQVLAAGLLASSPRG